MRRRITFKRDWAIRDSSGLLIGGIGLLYNDGLHSHRSEIGFWLGKKYWNNGIMTEVLKSFSQYIFDNTRMIRLEALVFQNNVASCRVLEKSGFEREGLLKSVYLKGSKVINAFLFSKIKP